MQQPGPNNNYGIIVSLIPLVAGALSLLSIQVTYYWARFNNHVKPFPSLSISAAATHYPECMIFRAGIIISCFFISATFHIVSWWLDEINNRTGRYVYVKVNKLRIYGYVSMCLLIVSTATLTDGGDQNEPLHVFCATGFFVCVYFGLNLVTNTIQQIWAFKPRFIPLWSLYYQILMKWLGGIMLFINFISGPFSHYFVQHIHNYIEWYATYMILFTFVTIAVDLRYTSIYFALHMCRTNQDQENSVQRTRNLSIINQ